MRLDPGKKRLAAEKEEAMVNATLYSKPPTATHWMGCAPWPGHSG